MSDRVEQHFARSDTQLAVKGRQPKMAAAAVASIPPTLLLNVTHGRYTFSLQTVSLAAMKKRAKADIRERFGYAVKVRREDLGLTQEDLAEKARIHRTYLSDVERGTRNLSLINIERLAGALSMPISELFQLVERS